MSDQNHYHFVFMISAQEAIIEQNKHSLLLKGIDSKVLYMTARPGRERAFISAEKFINTWLTHLEAFEQNLPQIAIIYSEMTLNTEQEAQAIPVILNNPKKLGHDTWSFHFKEQQNKISSGNYKDIILFIDWFPALECPKPIQFLLPSLFS